jgi:hypothetical protein
MSKTVQMPKEIFAALVKVHIGHSQDPAVEKVITDWIQAKIKAMYRHDLYAKSKDSSLMPDEREAARMSYLEEKGISEDFRW